ncbi:lipopolysaccharide assembly protein LapB [Arcobacter sp. CECT 8985]|uniref:tetratricopeptide repeat protein n=1 Tax=Arcobacter sp. CECT 8985 TaxID=1935424 RepID=UPI00100AA94E|nr:tetratricopeptide repeat protein [Arcobacter sp. CECT 8985]RXJ87935.1 hypothetical protein CRU93_02015 [Arcobacter sp. CECT 8985]
MKVIVLLCFFTIFSFAKKDFYYSFINSANEQISQEKKQEITNGFEIINNVKKLAREGKIDEAYKEITDFKNKNKVKLLESDIYILYAELSLKRKSKRSILEATKELEDAINSSKIREDQLAKAYMFLVDLKLRSNKINEAKYFADIIINNFNDKVTKAYGKIHLAKVYKYEYKYAKAERILYEVLTKTTDILVATIVANELFDVYISDNKYDRAYELIKKVLDKNIDYYATDSYLALEQVDKLIKAKMPEFAVKILTELIKRTKDKDAVESFIYKLANTYMLMYEGTPKYLLKAKRLYEELLAKYPDGMYIDKAKMYIDEIFMREGKIKPSIISNKYIDSESMQQKVLLQELLNEKRNKDYETILKKKRVYSKISTKIARRFGFDSMNDIFDVVSIEMIKNFLNKGECSRLKETLKTSRRETLQKLIEDEDTKDKFFKCMIQEPYERAYLLAKEAFNSSRNAQLYLYLERMAYKLNKLKEAITFSAKVEMVNNKEVLKKEFLDRFLILNALNEPHSIERFYKYAQKHKDYIKANEDNPVIIDFYYQFYIYLLGQNKNKEAFEILNKLYKKQKDFKARVYSPFVEEELAKDAKNNNKPQKAIDYLLEGLNLNRKIKPNDLARTYYELIKSYESLGNKQKQDEYIKKCKDVQGATGSLYKKMCDAM